jgi:peptidoglycan/LPS O-acetylase OafA/YrhL
VIRWIVVGLLVSAGGAVLVLRWWRRRRGLRAEPDRRSPPAGWATAMAGVLVVALAVFVALVPMGSAPALIVLALGATIGTAGFAVASPRTRSRVHPGR